MSDDAIWLFSDSCYLNQDGDVVISTLPDDLCTMLLALIKRNDLIANWSEEDGHVVDWDGYNVMLSWSGYLPPTNVLH